MKTGLYIYFLSFLFFFLPCNLKAACNHKNVEYNWVNHPIHFYNNVIIDTTFTPHPLLLETLGAKKGIISSLLPFSQFKSTNSNITVKLKYKTKNCENLSVIITSIGECENINSMDTIQLRPAEDWVECTQIINIKKAYLLNISIEAIGFKNNNANVWVSDYGVFADKEEVNNNLKEEQDNSYINKNNVIHWDNIDHHTVPFLEHRILAIGETVHGTKTMNDIAIAIIKERILKHKCRFVLLEIPLEYSFYINRYVHNDPNFKLSDISTFFDIFLYSESILSFIQWVKEYNSKNDENISIWGFDINYVQLKSRVDLFNFLYNLNTNKRFEELDSIYKLLLDTKTSFEKIISVFNENNNLTTMFNEDELKLMLYCMKITQQYSSSCYRYINRDKYMTEIATFIIDNFLKKNETATIFAHFGHLNYLTTQESSLINYSSCGYYMKSKYKDDYRCIALTTNQGTAMLTKSGSTFGGASKLIQPPQESLEYQLNRLNMDSIYLPMSGLSCSDVFKIRIIGNSNTENQFRYIIPKSRIDGVLFIKKSVSIEKKEDVLKSNLNFNFIIMDSYGKALEKIKNK